MVVLIAEKSFSMTYSLSSETSLESASAARTWGTAGPGDEKLEGNAKGLIMTLEEYNQLVQHTKARGMIGLEQKATTGSMHKRVITLTPYKPLTICYW